MRLFVGKYSVLVEEYAEVLYKDGVVAIYRADRTKEVHLDPSKVEKVGIYKRIDEDTLAWQPVSIDG